MSHAGSLRALLCAVEISWLGMHMARLVVYIATQLKFVQANKSYSQELYGTSPIGRCSPHQWLTSLIISVAMGYSTLSEEK